jgi:hypothetical protein
MRPALLPVLVGLLLLPGSGGAEDPPPGAPEAAGIASLPADVREALEEDGIALGSREDSDDGRVTAWVVFEAPVEATYLLLSQTERQEEYRSELQEVRRIVVERQRRIDEHRIRILFLSVRYLLEYRFDPASRRIEWKLVEGRASPLEHVSGSWQLRPLGRDRTLARFETTVRIGKGLPNALQDRVTRSRVPGTLEASMRWVNAQAASLPRGRAMTSRSSP